MINPIHAITQTSWTSGNKGSCASAMGQDKAWENLTPFCAGLYVNTCPLTGRAKQGVIKHSNQPLSSDFPTKNKSLRAKPRSSGVYPSLSLITFSYQLCLGLMCPSTVVQCSLSEEKPFWLGFCSIYRDLTLWNLYEQKEQIQTLFSYRLHQFQYTAIL